MTSVLAMEAIDDNKGEETDSDGTEFLVGISIMKATKH